MVIENQQNDIIMMPYINDVIYGQLEFKPIIFNVIDTPEFQRIRRVKQLGINYLVFPSANHTRFEHCIGACYLAGKLMKILEMNSGREIPEHYKDYVMIAALLHDVGHAAFSHMWEKFTERIGISPKYDHEQLSRDIAGRIFDKYPGTKLSDDYKEHEKGVKIIQNLIVGDRTELRKLLSDNWIFLSEIVHNKFSETDVDKWDYIVRDRYYLNNAVQFSLDFFSLFNRITIHEDENNESHIVYDIADYDNACKLYEARIELHKTAYQHPIVIVAEEQLIDILVMAEKFGYMFKGMKLSKVHLNLDVFLELDDTILCNILMSENNSLINVQEKIRLFKSRELYQIIDEPTAVQKMISPKAIVHVRNPGNKMLRNKVFYRKVNGRIETIQVDYNHFPEGENAYESEIYIDKNNNSNEK